ncbi:MAG TPA: pentapeptide repeat-containing protein [Gemmataceae bacterium]|nr:pentapeptide repeat-containing protein [Gemmataceae bacterium]
MIEPKQAPVRPRVLSLPANIPLLLDEEICFFVEAGARGNIAILGCVGSGKTTALGHLATLPSDYPIALLDEPKADPLVNMPDGLVIYTAVAACPVDHLAIYSLAPWNQDDLIEYLLAAHRPRCASVMRRIRVEDHFLLDGLAELWRIVLDRLASDDALPDVRDALHCHLQEYLTDTDLLERARSACLNVAVMPELSLADGVLEIVRPGFAESLIRLLRHPPMQRMLATERIAADLHGEAGCDYLAERLPRDLIEATGRLIVGDDRAFTQLHVLLAGPPWSHAMTASILHAAGASAILRGNCPSQLAGAYLSHVGWPGVQLPQADLRETDLTEADLRRANLMRATASKVNLRQARLMGACLDQFSAEEADLRGADLTGVSADAANFTAANLEQADFTSACLPETRFVDSNLSAAVFRKAILFRVDFTRAILTDADFSSADLKNAVLSGLCLREAHWEEARFTEAQLIGCDLEYMNLAADFEKANLHGALLTGSTIFGGNFRGACLCAAGLADIEWEGADLRDADLRGASFHMGSTRSGLVGSTIPCEGSKTGFYTDDYDEQTYKAPEEIRKANLCCADLRGAILDGVDFYLVDLRGALYDVKYEEHLRRCGAILETHV